MAGELTVEQLAGIAASTLAKYKIKGKPNLIDMMTDTREFIVLPRLLRKNKIKVDGGKSIQREAIVDHGHTFKGVGLHDENKVTYKDNPANYTIPWRHVKVHTGWELHEIDMNSGANAIYNLIESRWDSLMYDEADGFERAFWVEQASDDGLLPYSIHYYVVRHTTGTSATTGGLNGGNNSWSVAPGGLTAAASNNRYKNWTFAFSSYTSDDLLEKWWRAYLRCRYKSPVTGGQMASGPADREWFVTTEGLIQMRKLAENRNENLGYDLGISPDGGIKFGGLPIHVAPLLDEISDDVTYQSIYGLDWRHLYFVFLNRWYRKQYGPKASAVQRNSVELIRDSTCNLACDCRRTQILGSKV